MTSAEWTHPDPETEPCPECGENSFPEPCIYCMKMMCDECLEQHIDLDRCPNYFCTWYDASQDPANKP